MGIFCNPQNLNKYWWLTSFAQPMWGLECLSFFPLFIEYILIIKDPVKSSVFCFIFKQNKVSLPLYFPSTFYLFPLEPWPHVSGSYTSLPHCAIKSIMLEFTSLSFYYKINTLLGTIIGISNPSLCWKATCGPKGLGVNESGDEKSFSGHSPRRILACTDKHYGLFTGGTLHQNLRHHGIR